MVTCKIPMCTGTERALTISTVSRGSVLSREKTGMAGEVVATVGVELKGPYAGPLFFDQAPLLGLLSH
jgi:hypothetical protein